MRACPQCQRTYPDDTDFCPRDGSPLPPDSLHRVIPADAGIQIDANLAAGLSRRFRIVRRLGAGGMGRVLCRAERRSAQGRAPLAPTPPWRLALKVLNRKLLDDPEFLLRFQNEAASTGRIHHANVVTIYESGQADDGTPYIAMEFLEGESLRQALKRRGALPVPEVAEILQQAARGLNAAHKLGIIHRDLKPDNIFLTRGDEDETIVKVVDFGIAKLRESATHTQTGLVLGTPAYMSFEQASGMRSDELDARSDIYSLGVVVYEMLTGRTPFHSDTPVGYLRKHMMEEPPPFRAIAPGLGVPPAVESSVMRALVKDRDQRYMSALGFARELVSAAPLSPRAGAPVALPSTRIVSPPARSPAVKEPDSPKPVAATAQAKADTAVQTPPPALPGKIDEAPSAQREGSRPGPAASLPAASRPPQFRGVSKPPSKTTFAAIAGVAVLVLGAAMWYLSQPSGQPRSREESQPNQESSSRSTLTPASTPPTAAPTAQKGAAVGPPPPSNKEESQPKQRSPSRSTPTPTSPPPSKPQPPQRIRVGGQVMSARLIFHPKPEYPPLAKMARVQGVVRLDAVIGKDGTVQELRLISGHPLLVKAAMDAVKDWRYQPTLLKDESVEVATEIDVNFALAL
jgi:serine/threonine-protein kinase